MTLTLGSLFSGIGGLELGFERTGGFVTRWQVENDPYAIRVLEKHWPDVRRYGDITKLSTDELERVDVIVGGFPCQDVSVAGKGAGLDGARSGLWTEYIRIVRALRPRYVVVENVPGLFVRGFGRVLGDLAQSGYDAEWQVLSAAGVGAPHRRERVFLVAYTCDGGQWELFQSECKRGSASSSDVGSNGETQPMADASRQRATATQFAGHPYSPVSSGEDVADAKRLGLEEQGYTGIPGATRRPNPASNASWWAVEPNVGRVAHGVPARVERLRCLGNAVVPQVAQYVAECILAAIERERQIA